MSEANLNVNLRGRDQLSDSLSKVRDKLKGLETGLDKTTKKTKDFNKATQALGKGLAGLAVGAVAAGTAIGALVIKTNSMLDVLAKTAKRTGTTVEFISGLKFAAEQSGIAFEQLSSGLQIFVKNIRNSASGTGAQAEAFKRLGVSSTDSNGQLRSIESLLPELATSFKSMSNEVEKGALAQDLFGKSGGLLLPLFNEGADGIKVLTDRAKELGIVFDTQAAANAEKFNDNMNELKSSLQGAAVVITNNLNPVLTDLIRDITDFTSKKENIEAIGEAFKNVADGIKTTVKVIDDNKEVLEFLLKLGPTLAGAAAGFSVAGVPGAAIGAGLGGLAGADIEAALLGTELEGKIRRSQNELEKQKKETQDILNRLRGSGSSPPLGSQNNPFRSPEVSVTARRPRRNSTVDPEPERPGTLTAESVVQFENILNNSLKAVENSLGVESGAARKLLIPEKLPTAIVDLTSVFSDVGSSIVDAFANGTNAIESFINALTQAVSSITKTLLDTLIQNSFGQQLNSASQRLFGANFPVEGFRAVQFKRGKDGEPIGTDIGIFEDFFGLEKALNDDPRLKKEYGIAISNQLRKGTPISRVANAITDEMNIKTSETKINKFFPGALGAIGGPLVGLGLTGVFGALGGLFGKKEEREREVADNIELIAVNTGRQNDLLSKLINAPAGFSNSSFSQLSYAGISRNTFDDFNR